MKKRGTDITPEDCKKLQDENARLQSDLKREMGSPPLPLSCSVIFFANAAAVSTINVTKPQSVSTKNKSKV